MTQSATSGRRSKCGVTAVLAAVDGAGSLDGTGVISHTEGDGEPQITGRRHPTDNSFRLWHGTAQAIELERGTLRHHTVTDYGSPQIWTAQVSCRRGGVARHGTDTATVTTPGFPRSQPLRSADFQPRRHTPGEAAAAEAGPGPTSSQPTQSSFFTACSTAGIGSSPGPNRATG